MMIPTRDRVIDLHDGWAAVLKISVVVPRMQRIAHYALILRLRLYRSTMHLPYLSFRSAFIQIIKILRAFYFLIIVRSPERLLDRG